MLQFPIWEQKFGREEEAQALVDEYNAFMDEYRSKNEGKESPRFWF